MVAAEPLIREPDGGNEQPGLVTSRRQRGPYADEGVPDSRTLRRFELQARPRLHLARRSPRSDLWDGLGGSQSEQLDHRVWRRVFRIVATRDAQCSTPRGA